MKVVTKNSRGQVEATFEYDALGRRIGKTETTTETNSPHAHQESVRFVWQGLRMVQEVDPDYVRSYVYSPDAAWTPLARADVTNLDEVPDAFRTLAMTRPRAARRPQEIRQWRICRRHAKSRDPRWLPRRMQMRVDIFVPTTSPDEQVKFDVEELRLFNAAHDHGTGALLLAHGADPNI